MKTSKNIQQLQQLCWAFCALESSEENSPDNGLRESACGWPSIHMNPNDYLDLDLDHFKLGHCKTTSQEILATLFTFSTLFSNS